jgi:hypothetical protein
LKKNIAKNDPQSTAFVYAIKINWTKLIKSSARHFLQTTFEDKDGGTELAFLKNKCCFGKFEFVSKYLCNSFTL